MARLPNLWQEQGIAVPYTMDFADTMNTTPNKNKPAGEGSLVVFTSDADLKRIVEVCSSANAYISVITTGHLAGSGQLFVRTDQTGDFRILGMVSLDLMRQIVRHPRFYRDTAQSNRWRMRPPM